jgi:hypothetical protein
VENKSKSAPKRTSSVDVWCIYKIPNAEIKAPTNSINRDLLVIPGEVHAIPRPWQVALRRVPNFAISRKNKEARSD